MRDGRSPFFHKLEGLLLFIDEPAREVCRTILEQEAGAIAAAPGSKHNH